MMALLILIAVYAAKKFIYSQTRVDSFEPELGQKTISLKKYEIENKYHTMKQKKQLEESEDWNQMIESRGGKDDLDSKQFNWQSKHLEALAMNEEELQQSSVNVQNDAYVNEGLGSESDESDAMERELELMERQIREEKEYS